MSEALGFQEQFTQPRLRTRVARRFLRERAVARLSGVRGGQIHIREGADFHRVLGRSVDRAPLEVWVHDARFWSMLAFQGSVGVGEAYARGYWDCSDLTECLALASPYTYRLDQDPPLAGEVWFYLARQVDGEWGESGDGKPRNALTCN